MSYSLIIDEKIEVWKRTYVNVEADNLDIAVKKCLDADYDTTYTEILYETENALNPSDVNGATVEIYSPTSSDYEPIYTNDPYKNDNR